LNLLLQYKYQLNWLCVKNLKSLPSMLTGFPGQLVGPLNPTIEQTICPSTNTNTSSPPVKLNCWPGI